MPIHILSPEIASQIAAGEVVERPASVVKEAIENAIDAGASVIEIVIEEAGKKVIEIQDNGIGMELNELPLAVERHATSKLQNSEDLFKIGTLGFRGEALASIGSISRLTITSRTSNAQFGGKLVVEGGISQQCEPYGSPQGSTIRVENLFYNVPARLKFLKQDITERRVIDTLVSRYALAYPQIRFKLTDNQATALQTSGDGDRRAIIASIYGIDTAKQMLEVIAVEDDLKLVGFISPASITRSNRKEITFFINGRWVMDSPLTQALMQAYNTLLMVGRYPMGYLFLQIEPSEVDVNVHPTKAEVRFKNQDRVFSFVQRSVKRALLAYAPVPGLSSNQNLWSTPVYQSNSDSSTSFINRENQRLEWSFGHSDQEPTNTPTGGSAQIEAYGEPESGYEALVAPMLRLVGQVGATYLITEGVDGLYLIDQHAAHERILYEKLMTQHEKKALSSQSLLSPQVIQLDPASSKLIEDQLPILKHFGFEIDNFGPNTYQIRAIPSIFTQGDPSRLLKSLVEDFEEDETPLKNEVEARIAGRVCKTMAIKAGQVLTSSEQLTLLADLERCVNPRTCPHGRPTMIHLSVDLLERQFGRRGAR